MERVIGWADANGGQGWQAMPGAETRFGPKEGVTLRPTGMVVFATLESADPRPVIGRTGADPTWTCGRTLRLSDRVGLSPTPSTTPRAPQWRRRASRGAAWLLGR